MLSETLSFVREVTSAEAISGVRVIRSLWAGYGTIARVGLVGGEVPEVVVKEVRPAPSSRDSAVSDARKQRSYAVEAAFYASHAPTLGERVRVPRLLGHREWPSGQASGARVLVLEDLARTLTMALLINDNCTACDACKPVCPNEAIAVGDPIYIIDPLRCTECVGAEDEPQCRLVCPADCIDPNPDFQETPEELMAKYESLH